ncbi:hypothetical protein TGRH88_042180 [Toxoplasma gondii]|uniref:Uncharacterized protein n=1 Tax=Toxoplasma gondii TaxID=5811 RepID=A0A7J6JYN6_TOXGO|nr:hypothetical protein TGRH88_042180 [Toxoplasma gondii]
MAETIDGDRAKAESKVKAYKKNLQGMSDLQNSLTDELAAARMEKKEVKTIFREQLVKIRKEQDELKEEAAKHQSVVQAWMDQVAKLRQEVDATELENYRLREQLSEIRTIANELTLQKEELST